MRSNDSEQSKYARYFMASGPVAFFVALVTMRLERKIRRRVSRTEAVSLSLSAMMSRAPASASSTEATLSPTYFCASAAGSVNATLYILSAKGSRPASLATVARVRRFGLYGRYISSSSRLSTQSSMRLRSSSVIAPACPIASRTVSLRFSISANTSAQCLTSATATSSNPPVLSLR